MEAMAIPHGNYYDYQIQNGSGYILNEDGSYLPLRKHFLHPCIYIHSINTLQVFGRHHFTDPALGYAPAMIHQDSMGSVTPGKA